MKKYSARRRKRSCTDTLHKCTFFLTPFLTLSNAFAFFVFSYSSKIASSTLPPSSHPSILPLPPFLQPEIVTKYMYPVFSYFCVIYVTGLGIYAANSLNPPFRPGAPIPTDNQGAYIFATILAIASVLVELAVDKRNPELSQSGRFDLGLTFIAYGIIRLESSMVKTSTIDDQTTEYDFHLFFDDPSFALASDLFFFFGFVGAKLFNPRSSREVALLVMASIVDYCELTYSIRQFKPDGTVVPLNQPTIDAILAFTFIFMCATPVLSRMETQGQKSLNALFRIIMVHLPIICVRAAIPIDEGGMTSFNAVFILKNVIELFVCVLEFLEAGASISFDKDAADAAAASTPQGQQSYERI